MKKVNLGIIGLGNQGKIHLSNCLRLKEAKLLGVSDVSKNALKFAENKGVKNIYTNYDDLLKNKQLDAVIISLPNFLHLEGTIKAAEAGKDILLEKPLARNVEEGKRILSSTKRCGIKLMLSYELRFNKTLRKIHDEIIEGYFGKVQIVEATNVSGGPFSSRSNRTGPIPVPPWWFDKKLVGGGVLLDLGSHLINLLNWYFGEISNLKSYLGYILNMDIEDVAICMLKYKNGPIATIKVGWFSKEYNLSTQIYGTAKNLSVHIAPSSTINTVWWKVKEKIGWYNHDLLYSELKYFIKCLLKDEQPHPSGEEGLRDLQTISMAYKNALNFL